MYRIRVAGQDIRKTLWDNVCTLMEAQHLRATVDAVQAKTRIGRGTAQRLKEQSASVGLDIVQQIASAFRLEPWELLHPDLAKQAPTPRTPPKGDALDEIREQLERMPPDRRAELADLMAAWVKSAGKPGYRLLIEQCLVPDALAAPNAPAADRTAVAAAPVSNVTDLPISHRPETGGLRRDADQKRRHAAKTTSTPRKENRE